MNENKPVLFRERPFREKRIQALLAQFRTPILLFSPFRGKEVRGAVSKKSMKHQKPYASVPLWFKIPHFESKYKKSQERLIYFLKHIGKEYKKQNKSYFSSCIPQSSRSYKDDDSFIDKSVSGRVIIPHSLYKQNRIHYFTDNESRDKYYDKAVRRYENKQHVTEQALPIHRRLRKQDSTSREVVTKTYLAKAQVFFDSYPDVKSLLHFSGELNLIQFAHSRKGHKAILREKGYDKRYFKMLDSYQDKFQQYFRMYVTVRNIGSFISGFYGSLQVEKSPEEFYDLDYRHFKKIIRHAWLAKIYKFFSGRIDVGGRTYILPAQQRKIYEEARLLLNFSHSNSLTEFLENFRRNVSQLKEHKFSDSLIQCFKEVVKDISSERRIAKDAFFYFQNREN